MNIAFYSGASGLLAYQEQMDVIGHNISNVGTTGYKAERATFEDLLYTRMAVNDENDHLVGHGVRNRQRDILFGQGTPVQTGNPLDYAIMGDGFFAVDRAGEIQYTRNGAFDISLEGDQAFLVTTDGAYVLDGSGARIELPRQTSGTEDTGSASSVKGFDLTGVKNMLGVYYFPNVYGLEATNRSSFLATDTSGVAVSSTDATGGATGTHYLIESALEQSSVELPTEMANMITAQRAYQFSSKLVQTADELEEILNNLR